jgi:hypothetical protein
MKLIKMPIKYSELKEQKQGVNSAPLFLDPVIPEISGIPWVGKGWKL